MVIADGKGPTGGLVGMALFTQKRRSTRTVKETDGTQR